METKGFLNKIADKQNLTKKESSFLLEQIISGQLSPSQIAAVLMGLRTKGESVEEILGFIKTMRKHMIKIFAPNAIDIVGTGGDGIGTFNISTTSSLVVAGGGVRVAKHGNKASSSLCGSTDVLEALGVNINLTPYQTEKVLTSIGMTFLFAPLYHPAMKNIAPIRRELGIRTVFNFLGPFLNPASTKRQLIGVPNTDIAKKLAKVATNLNYDHLLIVTSIDGMDEITTTGQTTVFEIKNTKSRSYQISPQQFGIKKANKKNLLGADAKKNAEDIMSILKGEKGPKRDIVILNSAAAFYVAGRVKNIKMGIRLADKSIDSGAALKTLKNLIKESNKYA